MIGDDPVDRAGVIRELASLYENRGEIANALDDAPRGGIGQHKVEVLDYLLVRLNNKFLT